MDGIERILTELADIRNDIKKQIESMDSPALLIERIQAVKDAAGGLVEELDEMISKMEQ